MQNIQQAFVFWWIAERTFLTPFSNLSRMTCKTNKMSVRPAKTQISLGIRSVWSESSLSAWNLGSLATHWAHSEDCSDWADAQADRSFRWAHSHFVGFVMSWLIYVQHQ